MGTVNLAAAKMLGGGFQEGRLPTIYWKMSTTNTTEVMAMLVAPETSRRSIRRRRLVLNATKWDGFTSGLLLMSLSSPVSSSRDSNE